MSANYFDVYHFQGPKRGTQASMGISLLLKRAGNISFCCSINDDCVIRLPRAELLQFRYLVFKITFISQFFAFVFWLISCFQFNMKQQLGFIFEI